MIATEWKPYDPCPCPIGCGVIGWKLKQNGHVVGCVCRPCLGKRNQKKGRASEARAWKQMGGTGQTRNDDTYHGFELTVSVENKVGAQIPAKLVAFVNSAWLRHAMAQARKKNPIGSNAYPAVRLEMTPSRAFLLVDISPFPSLHTGEDQP